MLKFSFDTQLDSTRQDLVDGLVTLAKISLSKKATTNKLAKNYSVMDVDYSELNKATKEGVLAYSAKQSGIDSSVDVNTKEGLANALMNQTFEWNFFSIQTATLAVLLADTEVEAMTGFITMSTVGLGDSLTFDIGTKALYEVEDASYGNTVTRPRKHFKQPITITPSPKEASVQFDVIQMLTANYDFGAEIAKIVLSIRTKQYQDAVTLLFDGSPIAGTPFVKNTFNLANYTELQERLGAVNNSTVVSYGTKGAFRTASATITTGFTTLDEINKQGFISDLFGVPTRMIEQSVDTSNANFNFRVPADKIVMIAGDTPIKLVQENYVAVINEDGMNKNIRTKVYKYIFSYGMAIATGNPYAIQEV